MPCHAAIAEKTITLAPDHEVEKAIKELQKKKQEAAAVVNKDGEVEGLFSLNIVMKNLLPVSVAMSDGIQLDVTVRAAPGIAKRLRKVYPLPVSDIMERKFNTVGPETPIWEAVNQLVTSSTPLLVTEGENKKYLGLLTAQSAMDELKRLEESES